MFVLGVVVSDGVNDAPRCFARSPLFHKRTTTRAMLFMRRSNGSSSMIKAVQGDRAVVYVIARHGARGCPVSEACEHSAIERLN
jgi:hypothetical protein